MVASVFVGILNESLKGMVQKSHVFDSLKRTDSLESFVRYLTSATCKDNSAERLVFLLIFRGHNLYFHHIQFDLQTQVKYYFFVLGL